MSNLHARLLGWYAERGRDLPWRLTKDPYAIWVSEVMLQQTQVATALPYYERWLKRFPTLESLSVADDDEVLAQWQGLGYYRRAKLFQKGAREVTERGWPRSRDEWLDISGVGPYTAGALSSICLGLPEAVVDGNVERVFARLTGCDADGSTLNREAWKWARANMHAECPATWNQALMELGATVCKPGRPDCARCPISVWCVARQSNRERELPSRPAKRRPVEIRRTALVHWHDGRFALRRIGQACGSFRGLETRWQKASGLKASALCAITLQTTESPLKRSLIEPSARLSPWHGCRTRSIGSRCLRRNGASSSGRAATSGADRQSISRDLKRRSLSSMPSVSSE